MEVVLNQNLEDVPEPITLLHGKTHGLLTSKYKAIVKQNFSSASTQTLFGVRQRLKSVQLHMVNHTAVILKLTVFAVVLVGLS